MLECWDVGMLEWWDHLETLVETIWGRSGGSFWMSLETLGFAGRFQNHDFRGLEESLTETIWETIWGPSDRAVL